MANAVTFYDPSAPPDAATGVSAGVTVTQDSGGPFTSVRFDDQGLTIQAAAGFVDIEEGADLCEPLGSGIQVVNCLAALKPGSRAKLSGCAERDGEVGCSWC
ncbi:MAG TPA: hypothetical protein VK821_12870, partial [Dehalococcoidia bacterium]|nr:hypothetical protein [Dehalococcoidia bacterium]